MVQTAWATKLRDKLLRLNRVSKAFLILATADCFIIIVLALLQLITGYTTVGTSTTDKSIGENGVPRYVYWSILEILTVCFFLYFAWDSVLTENVFELWAFQIATFLASVYAVIQYYSVEEENNTVGAFQLAVILTFQVCFWALSYTLHRSFGWWVFRRLGADIELKSMYKNYQLFLAQVKFDLQFGLLLVMMSTFFFAAASPVFVFVEIVMLAFTIFYATLGIRGIQREDRRLMHWFFGLGIIAPINIVIKAVLIASDPDDYGANAPYAQMAVTASLAIINRITVMINGKRAYENFGRGLRENAFDHTNDDDAAEAPEAMDVALLPVFDTPSSNAVARGRHSSLTVQDYDPNLVDASALFQPTLES
ncbi:uncharacterized protein AMSG_03988 [Thecamonas trahens ATCC 50062]|uniref:DUF7789 domain-containing protein n=1 Tax=Thecamonas trahens ATCC 50062 TaxID=461836 RepID=A0A0L0D6Q1_THETB|nr:hypothetical protein AMSG_03988 [Thecamonas trahens ATCC 50062]KNC47761.1 hypothetical protein AMSG_03988 [Thecamonas trahens ATCC 50062]|eukprot:XP_013759239.1 hypothetical protein AMSG_03988 [Thecamonas trahens ATCC 50062]